MEPEFAMDIGRRTLMLVMVVALPMLLVGLVVGVVISILQAVTQIQEMTLTFVPKIISIILAGIFFMPFIMDKLMTFAKEMFGPMPIP